jgi:hypothetical protein
VLPGLYDLTWDVPFTDRVPTVVVTKVFGDLAVITPKPEPLENAIVDDVTKAGARVALGDVTGKLTDGAFGFVVAP